MDSVWLIVSGTGGESTVAKNTVVMMMLMAASVALPKIQPLVPSDFISSIVVMATESRGRGETVVERSRRRNSLSAASPLRGAQSRTSGQLKSPRDTGRSCRGPPGRSDMPVRARLDPASLDIGVHTRIIGAYTHMSTEMTGAAIPSMPCNCAALREAARYVTQVYDQHVAAAGLRITQYSILARLKRLGPMTINALAQELVMDRTTLGRNIVPLQREGLIAANRGCDDRRSKELHLTKAGLVRLSAAAKGWGKAQAQFEATFGSDRASELRALLRAVVGSGLRTDSDTFE